MLWVGQLCIRKPVPYKYAVKLLDVRRFTLYSPGNTPNSPHLKPGSIPLKKCAPPPMTRSWSA